MESDVMSLGEGANQLIENQWKVRKIVDVSELDY